VLKTPPDNDRLFFIPVFLQLWPWDRTMRKKSSEIHEKQIRSMSVLSPTSYLNVKITEYVFASQKKLDSIHSFHSKVPNGRPVARFSANCIGFEVRKTDT
jgi:hypothetical protein